MKILDVNPRELVFYENNPREHSEAQIKKLVSLISEFGFIIPVVVDKENVIVKGEACVKAALILELETVPVLRAEHLSEAQLALFRLADNRIAEDASWNKERLAAELKHIRDDLKVSLSLSGFEDREILSLHLDETEGCVPEDVIPEPDTKVVVSEPGNVWLLGNHRIICGDCTSPDAVNKLLGGLRPHLMVTDPPYGVNYDPSWRNKAGLSDSKRTGSVLNDHKADWREAWELFPGDVCYIWHGSLHGLAVAESLKVNNFQLRSQIIWVKPRFILSRGDIHWQHEVCFYAVKGKESCSEPEYDSSEYDSCLYAVRESEISHWQGARNISSVWDIDYKNQDEKTIHGTQKPVECMRRPMLNNSKVDEYVYEPFSGSGTTIIAAQSCRRRCLAVELNPEYVDIAVRRWQHFTCQTAVLEETGESFDIVRKRKLRDRSDE